MTDWLRTDELMHFSYAQSPLLENFIYQFKTQAHPPLTYILMKPFLAFGESVYAVRALSFLSGLAAILIIYKIINKICLSVWTSFLGTLFISSIPVFVMQSVDARHYSLCLVFVWLSIFQYFRMCDKHFRDFRDHCLLATIICLILLTEYSAAFHVSALLILTLGPLFFSCVKENRIGLFVRYIVPYLIVLLGVFLLFRWQFKAVIPVYSHTRYFMYDGKLTDFIAIVDFFVNRFSALMQSVLPNPWGMSLVLLNLLAFIPLCQNKYLREANRNFALHGFICIILVFFLSLNQLFPFGGYPRHSVFLVPGILLSCVVSMEELVVCLGKRSKIRTFLLLSLFLVWFMPGYFRKFSKIKTNLAGLNYENIMKITGFDEYPKVQSPIITNYFGKFIVGWWLLPTEFKKKYSPRENIQFYEYSGTVVSTVNGEKDIFWFEAMRVAKEKKRCWVVIAAPADKKYCEDMRDYFFEKNEDEKMFNISANGIVKYHRALYLIVLKINLLSANNR